MKFHILTLFPEICEPFLKSSLLGKAQEKGVLQAETVQIRDFSNDKHRTVDDTPYGGGEGMLIRTDVLYGAWSSVHPTPEDRASSPKTRTILLSPQGGLFTHQKAKDLATSTDQLILVSGHYEGVDERFIELCVDEEISIGDYVLTGGELPALVVADAVSRWIPGVVGKEASVSRDSLEGGLLKHPQYTRPREFMGLEIPEVLLSGNHGEIEKWRKAQAEERTARKRPDLLSGKIT